MGRSLGSEQAPTGSPAPLAEYRTATTPRRAAASKLADNEPTTVAQKRSPSLDLETEQNTASPFVRDHPVADEACELPGVLALGPAGPFKPMLSAHPLQRCGSLACVVKRRCYPNVCVSADLCLPLFRRSASSKVTESEELYASPDAARIGGGLYSHVLEHLVQVRLKALRFDPETSCCALCLTWACVCVCRLLRTPHQS
jgi:hypothetical protein